MTIPSRRIYKDCYDILCARQLGFGEHRTVYVCRIDRNLVVKIENNPGAYGRNFMNVAEFNFWNEFKHNKKVAEWLAPCMWMSQDGHVMIQRRCVPVDETQRHLMPDKLPAFLRGLKTDNFGWLDGKLVCMDYALNMQTASMRMQKANWR